MEKKILEKCPKTYVKWTFLIAGMIVGFFFYLILMNLNICGTEEDPETFLELYSIPDSAEDALVLTEHTNEEDDYDKPICKRLEESGERYEDDEEDVYYGQI